MFSIVFFLIFSIQGQSIYSPTKVVLDVSSCFEPGQAYVMLSRVQSLKQVYILNKLDVDRIKISGQAFFELERLEAISFNKNLSPWYDEDSFHVASLNCAGLMLHMDDIRNDQKLLHAELIQLQEISLATDHQGIDACKLPGYDGSFDSSGRGRGIASFRKGGTVSASFKEEGFQISKLEINGVHCFNIYRSQEGSLTRMIEILEDQIDSG